MDAPLSTSCVWLCRVCCAFRPEDRAKTEWTYCCKCRFEDTHLPFGRCFWCPRSALKKPETSRDRQIGRPFTDRETPGVSQIGRPCSPWPRSPSRLVSRKRVPSRRRNAGSISLVERHTQMVLSCLFLRCNVIVDVVGTAP